MLRPHAYLLNESCRISQTEGSHNSSKGGTQDGRWVGNEGWYPGMEDGGSSLLTPNARERGTDSLHCLSCRMQSFIREGGEPRSAGVTKQREGRSLVTASIDGTSCIHPDKAESGRGTTVVRLVGCKRAMVAPACLHHTDLAGASPQRPSFSLYASTTQPDTVQMRSAVSACHLLLGSAPHQWP